jgi:hypothetical protein
MVKTVRSFQIFEILQTTNREQALEGLDSTSLNHAQELPQPMPDFDPSLFASMSDVDLFSWFDPTFDLAAVDQSMGENLDLSFPSHFQ